MSKHPLAQKTEVGKFKRPKGILHLLLPNIPHQCYTSAPNKGLQPPALLFFEELSHQHY
jgi:hypothetical protein